MLVSNLANAHWDNILGDTAGNCLESPSLSVAEFTRTEEDIRSNNPGPEHLPKDRGPPLPATALSRLLLHGVAVDFSASDTEGVVKLAGDKKHEYCDNGLYVQLANGV